MTVTEAIARADELRPNALGEEQKAAWLRQLEGQLWELWERDGTPLPPEREKLWPWRMTWPEEDPKLLLTGPQEELYQLYLMAKIDYYNQEMDLYMNDMTLYNAALSEAQAWWRRHHRPRRGKNWRTL